MGKVSFGSGSTSFEFKRLVSNIIGEDIEHSHIPDHSVRFSDDERLVVFKSRGSVPVQDVFDGHIDPDFYDDARVAAPGWDVRYPEQEWRR